MRWLSPLIIILALSATVAAQPFSGRLRLQLAQEFDTNAQRIYGTTADDGDMDVGEYNRDLLTRILIQGHLDYRGSNHGLRLGYLGGAKLFYHKSSENLVANKLDGSYWARLSQKLALGMRLVVHDTTQVEHSRDYFSSRAEGFAQFKLTDWMSLEPVAGGRYFLFKPDEHRQALRFSHLAPLAGVRCRLRPTSTWSTWIAYEMEYRYYDQDTLDRESEPSGEQRQDMRHMISLGNQARWRLYHSIALITQLLYSFSANDSNSLGSSARWHRIRLVLSAQFTEVLSLHLMGSTQFTDHPDGLYLDETAYEPDADENENALVLRATWAFHKRWSLVLEGALYRNSFRLSQVSQPGFGRETISLGFAYGWEF